MSEVNELLIFNHATQEMIKIVNPKIATTEHGHFDKDCLTMRAVTQANKSWEVVQQRETLWRVSDYYIPQVVAIKRGVICEL